LNGVTAITDETVAPLRAELPGIEDGLYLNHGFSGRSPRAVGERIAACQQRWQVLGPGSPRAVGEGWAAVEAARTAVAGLVGAAREAIALTASTSIGLAIVLAGLRWQPGDELLLSDREHSGLLTPATALAQRSQVALRLFPGAATDPVSAIAETLTPRTRLVALSEVLFIDGRRLPVDEIARVCHANDTLLLVDGAQSVGVLPARPLEAGIDFYAATCHKWLSGPEGTGFLVVAPEHLARGTVHPTVVGYSATGAQPGTLSATASRYEGSTVNFADFAAVPIALDFLRRGGSEEARHVRIVSLARRFRDRLREIPQTRLLLEPDDAQLSGLVSWNLEGHDPEQVVSRLLDDHGICTRTVPSPRAARASFHFYNTTAEVDRLAEALGAIATSPR
jgi:L-cysteine/cystine lyase